MPRKIDPAVKERAFRMVAEHRGVHSSLTACCDQVGRRLGLDKETVRRWPVQADIDVGARPGVRTEESTEFSPGLHSRRLSVGNGGTVTTTSA
ncbi:hypothetical protein NGF75_08230 [Dietzia kunjamensis]|uniref:hypothetical protein n=1 Tax=Dietzia kunjamensis TaxID=322509 RepID=UPI002DB5801F|nr:hypothetical protein [Dietzia kunjamensis]MEB8325975.1 hypothetical protein [Dietzia kunjamensis]